MTERYKKQTNYFLQQTEVDFISSGCCMFDLVLGGGYPVGRLVNIVGDKSTGKTLLALEAIANFLQKYPGHRICYHETEAAFDKQYAGALGVPVDKIEFCNDRLIEELYENITKFLQTEGTRPCLYVIDSLDALSDTAESKQGITEGTYGITKAKQLGKLFRKLVAEIKTKNMLLIVISQIRDKIGVSFGEKYTRSGGHALDFYASQIVWLSELGKIKKTVSGITQPIGVNIKAKVKKNKVGLSFRECEFPILFGYGIDSVAANFQYLKSINQLPKGVTNRNISFKASKLRDSQNTKEIKKLDQSVIEKYRVIQAQFLPEVTKY